MEAVRKHVETHAPFGAAAGVHDRGRRQPLPGRHQRRAAAAAMWALGEAWGVPAVDMGVGGSIPFIADLTELYPDAQILVTGVEDPDSRAHSANESLHLDDFRNAICRRGPAARRLNAEGAPSRRAPGASRGTSQPLRRLRQKLELQGCAK